MITTWAIEIEGLFDVDKFPMFFEEHIRREYSEDENSSREIIRQVKQFETDYNCTIPENCKIFRGDGSVSFSDSEYDDIETNGRIVSGEIASPIFKRVKDLMRFIKDFYPLKTNSTCGIHLHHKPNLGKYNQAIMQYGKFKDDYMAFLNIMGKTLDIKTNHRFWYRMEHEHYCQNKLDLHDVKQQMANLQYDSARYRHINFCWSKHSTIELRSFPTFQDYTLAQKVIMSTINHIETWYATNKLKIKSKEIVL